MARMLLVGFADVIAADIAAVLQRQGHKTEIYEGEAPLTKVLAHTEPQPDLVLIDVSRDDRQTWDRLVELCHFRDQYGPAPMLVGVSIVKRGPRFELEIERKGARLVYVA